MVGWHHRLDGQESEQSPGVGEAQGSLSCTVRGVAKESGATELDCLTILEPQLQIILEVVYLFFKQYPAKEISIQIFFYPEKTVSY